MVLPQGAGGAAHGELAHHHGGRECSLPEGGREDEEGRRTLTLLKAAPGQIPEQHC
jgi:hypothetical protein